MPDDDIELPAIPQSLPGMSAAGPEIPAGVSLGGAKRPRRFRHALWAVGLLATVAVGAWFLQTGTSSEEGNPNWENTWQLRRKRRSASRRIS